MKCPKCNGTQVIKKGIRKTRYKQEQMYYCKTCKKRFIPRKLKDKTYPANVVITAINYYNLGYTIEETSRLINRRFKVKTSKSSVHNWLNEFSDVCSFQKIRKEMLKEYEKGTVVFTNSFEHQGLDYEFKYHKAKLERFASHFPDLISYLQRFEQGCPNELFEGGKRCSQLKFSVNVKKSRGKNQACRLAKLAMRAAEENRMRHEVVEEFMLINDTATVACEVPVWYWEKKLDVGVSGHIDILQIRQGKIFILDLKPEAFKENEEKVSSQLYLYALGLSFRTKIPLSVFRCAWFDENDYYEFSPANAEVRGDGEKIVRYSAK